MRTYPVFQKKFLTKSVLRGRIGFVAGIAQQVERFLGKEEVPGFKSRYQPAVGANYAPLKPLSVKLKGVFACSVSPPLPRKGVALHAAHWRVPYEKHHHCHGGRSITGGRTPPLHRTPSHLEGGDTGAKPPGDSQDGEARLALQAVG